jgi:hypothetical protein
LRTRLPAIDSGDIGLYAQVHYPSSTSFPERRVESFPWFRREVIDSLASSQSSGKAQKALFQTLADCPQLDQSYTPKDGNSAGWPIVVFSSGVFGSCEMYSQFCRELAAYGAIVIAIEHEDGSGCFATSATTGESVPNVSLIRIPDGCDRDVYRHPFLEQRADELGATAATVKHIVKQGISGDVPPEQALFASVMKSGNADQLLLMGHSFGSCGIARYLRRLSDSQQPCPYTGAVLLDVVGSMCKKQDMAHEFQLPFALVYSEEWERAGLEAADQMASGPLCMGSCVLRGSRHQWISESHFFLPKWLLRKLNIMGSGSFRRVHKATIQAMHHAMDALLGSAKAKDFSSQLAEIDSAVLVAFSGRSENMAK